MKAPGSHSPSAERSKGPILEQSSRMQWHPTDADPAALPSIAAWCAGLVNVAAPVLLDVMAVDWPFTGRSDADLRGRDPSCGLRRVADVCAEVAAAGIQHCPNCGASPREHGATGCTARS